MKPRLLLTLFLAALLPAHAAGNAPARKPNILLIVADDLGCGDVSVQGCKDFATPHLDSIAKAGMRFKSGYVTAPVCGPSRAGLITGRHPCRILPFEGNPPPGSDTGLPLEAPDNYLAKTAKKSAAAGK